MSKEDLDLAPNCPGLGWVLLIPIPPKTQLPSCLRHVWLSSWRCVAGRDKQLDGRLVGPQVAAARMSRAGPPPALAIAAVFTWSRRFQHQRSSEEGEKREGPKEDGEEVRARFHKQKANERWARRGTGIERYITGRQR